MASRFDGQNEYSIPKKVQAALHAISSSYHHSNKSLIYSVSKSLEEI